MGELDQTSKPCAAVTIDALETPAVESSAYSPLETKGPIGKPRPLELQSIQALRALAATTVIFAHVPFINRGGFGVNIFFVISGFIICYISSLNPSQFWLKRIFRI